MSCQLFISIFSFDYFSFSFSLLIFFVSSCILSNFCDWAFLILIIEVTDSQTDNCIISALSESDLIFFNLLECLCIHQRVTEGSEAKTECTTHGECSCLSPFLTLPFRILGRNTCVPCLFFKLSGPVAHSRSRHLGHHSTHWLLSMILMLVFSDQVFSFPWLLVSLVGWGKSQASCLSKRT